MFGGGACRVESCRRPARGHGLCQGHHLRWVGEGRPDLDGVRRDDRSAVAPAAPERRVPGRRMRLRCRPRRDVSAALPAVGPRRPTRPAPVAGRPADDQAAAAGCHLPDRSLRSVAAGGVAVLPQPRQHLEGQRATRHRRLRPRVRRGRGRPRSEIIRLDRLGPQLRLEIQYALQCRHDQRTTKTFPAVVMALVRAPRHHERGVAARPDRGRVADPDRATGPTTPPCGRC